MKKIIFILFTISVLFSGCEKDETPWENEQEQEPEDEPVKQVAIAYVTWYGTAIPDPAYITHLNYAFAEPYLRNGVYEGFKLQGNRARFQQMVDLKKINSNLKVCISFTNTLENSDNPRGGGFSLLAKSDAYRKIFAEDCKEFLEEWGIDGVDLDWEFPGLSWSSNHASPYDVAADVANHVKLMRQLRETLEDRYLLTYAGYCRDKEAVAGGYRYIDIKAVAPYVDFVNVMTYDLDEAPHHQSALSDPSAYSDCTRAIQVYRNAGMPASKLVLGIPFYGRHSFSTAPTAINYKNILTLDPAVYKIDNWDSAASVPYVTKDGVYYCGYDNARSITIKGSWVKSRGMKGMMYWDYDGDDSRGTLRNAVWNAVKGNN
ncbi:glycoside hydrolase family 18 protein [Dysgonomonas reticulitermitis]